MPSPCHAPTMPFFSRPQHSTAVEIRLCCGLENNGMVGAWHGHGMASVNHTRLHCVNQIGKTHSKLLAARHGRGTAWERHAMCESALRGSRNLLSDLTQLGSNAVFSASFFITHILVSCSLYKHHRDPKFRHFHACSDTRLLSQVNALRVSARELPKGA